MILNRTSPGSKDPVRATAVGDSWYLINRLSKLALRSRIRQHSSNSS